MALTFGGATSNRLVIAPNASIDDLSAFSILMWVYPTTITHQRRLCAKGVNIKEVELRNSGGESNALQFYVGRATALAVAQVANGTLATNAWQCFAFTYDESNGCQVFKGTLTSALAECSYASNSVGSGTTTADSSASLVIGNRTTSSLIPFQGRIATYQYFNARKTLADLQRYQFRPINSSDCVVFHWLGINGTTDVPDWSGNGNTGAITTAVVGDHVPLPRLWEAGDAASSDAAGAGSLAGTLGSVTSSATGDIAITGASAVTLGAIVSAATGALGITGVLNTTDDPPPSELASLTLVASGNNGGIDGALAATLDPLTAASSGQLPIGGSTGGVLDGLVAMALGDLAISGATGGQLGALTLAATGSLGLAGQSAPTLDPLTSVGASSLSIVGSTAAALAPLTLAAAGTGPVGGLLLRRRRMVMAA